MTVAHEVQPIVADRDLGLLIGSWSLSLRARRRSPRTIRSHAETAGHLEKSLRHRAIPTRPATIRRERIKTHLAELDSEPPNTSTPTKRLTSGQL